MLDGEIQVPNAHRPSLTSFNAQIASARQVSTLHPSPTLASLSSPAIIVPSPVAVRVYAALPNAACPVHPLASSGTSAALQRARRPAALVQSFPESGSISQCEKKKRHLLPLSRRFAVVVPAALDAVPSPSSSFAPAAVSVLLH